MKRSDRKYRYLPFGSQAGAKELIIGSLAGCTVFVWLSQMRTWLNSLASGAEYAR